MSWFPRITVSFSVLGGAFHAVGESSDKTLKEIWRRTIQVKDVVTNHFRLEKSLRLIDVNGPAVGDTTASSILAIDNFHRFFKAFDVV